LAALVCWEWWHLTGFALCTSYVCCRFVVRGVTINMPHVRSCIANADFKQGSYDTSFIPKYYGGPGEAEQL
jgi:hypothetical protein